MSYKILVVDDERDLRDFMTLFLRREGYDVKNASDGQEAFGLINQDRPDLVISDIRMPNWDGFDLMKRVSADLTPPRLPMLFISGYTDGRESLLQSDPNFAGFLAKPVLPETLVSRVQAIQNSLKHQMI